MNSCIDPVWQKWTERLKGWGVDEFTASVLEALGPFKLIGAQMIYIIQPVLVGIFPAEHLNALANLLEEPEQADAFVETLREVDE